MDAAQGQTGTAQPTSDYRRYSIVVRVRSPVTFTVHRKSDRSMAPKLFSESTVPVTVYGPEPETSSLKSAVDGDFNASLTLFSHAICASTLLSLDDEPPLKAAEIARTSTIAAPPKTGTPQHTHMKNLNVGSALPGVSGGFGGSLSVTERI